MAVIVSQDHFEIIHRRISPMSLRFTFLGTGAPPASTRRGGPSHLIQIDGLSILIDCGSGVSQALLRAGTTGAAIDALVVTHLHSDHIVDFYQLVISSWHQGRIKPWRVISTAPVIRALQGQYAAYREERDFRIAFENRPSSSGLDVVFEELVEGEISGLQELKLTAFLVDHAPVVPAFGLIAEHQGTRLVFSGDTKPCAVLERAAKGADLLVTEVFVDREMQPAAGIRSAATVAAVQSYHMTPEQIAGLACRSGARMVALTHLVPPGADSAGIVCEIGDHGYHGPVICAEDGLSINLPERLVRWKALSFQV
jgi:ribonuclease BN (tRNA processing enzyme)